MKRSKNVVPLWLYIFLGVFIFLGLCLLYFGISGQTKLNRAAAGYRQTVGYLSDYYPSISDDGSATYYLVYSYNVGGRDYTAVTDYSTSIVPRQGSRVKIRFDPEDPGKRIIQGTNGNYIMMFVGVMFTAVPGFMLYIFLKVNSPAGKPCGINVTTLFASLILIFIAVGCICIMAGSTDINDIINYYLHSFSFPMLIPVIMIAGGILGCISAISGRYYTGYRDSRQ